MTIDYARFRDLISVTEDDVYEYVVATAFQDGVDDDAEGRGPMTGCASCHTTMARWPVYNTKRGVHRPRSRWHIAPTHDARSCSVS